MPSKKKNKLNAKKSTPLYRKSALRKGDLVMVIAGGHKEKRPNKGQVGRIVGFTGKGGQRVLVEGLNLMTKHQRQTAPDKPHGIMKKEGGIHLSNVMYYVEKIKKPVRLRHKFLDDGQKVRGYTDPESKDFVQI